MLLHNKQTAETTDRKPEVAEVEVEIAKEVARPIRMQELGGATSGTTHHNNNNRMHVAEEEEELEAVQAGVSLMDHLLVHVSHSQAREVETTQTVVN